MELIVVLGVGITSAVLTDLLMKSLGDSLYNPLHFKALHSGLLSKNTLFNAADHLGMVPFLRYRLPFNVILFQCILSPIIINQYFSQNQVINHKYQL